MKGGFMSQVRLNMPLESVIYLWLTELTLRQRDRGVKGTTRQVIGKDRAIAKILEWVKKQPKEFQDQLFNDLIDQPVSSGEK